MQYTTINGTDLKVSRLCLGTMHYGLPSMNEKEVFTQLDSFSQAGGVFLDTAHVYSDWEPGTKSRSEKCIGRYLKTQGTRSTFVISTKGGHPLPGGKQKPRLSSAELLTDLNESLAYLSTDYIDLYFLHRDDPSIPVGEILAFLESQVSAGTIRYYGCSNWSLGRIKQAQAYAASHNMQGFALNQVMWSLARINNDALSDPSILTMDEQTYTYQRETNLPTMAFSSQAKGYFTIRQNAQHLPPETQRIYSSPINDQIATVLQRYKAQTGCSATTVALRWLMEQPTTCIPIVSCDNPSQLQDVLAACDATVPVEILDQLPRW